MLCAAAAAIAALGIQPASPINKFGTMRSAWVAGTQVAAVASTEAIDAASVANATLVWATGQVDVVTWIDSSGRWAVDMAAVAAACGTVTICEGVVYACGHGDSRCTAMPPTRSYTCTGGTATCVGPNGTAVTAKTIADMTVVWGDSGKTVWAFERPPKTGGMIICWILLVVINALRVNAFKTRSGRVDAAFVVASALVIRAAFGASAAAPPHIWSQTGAEAVDIAAAATAALVAAAAIAAATMTSVADTEPFRATTEMAALAATAAAFPQSVAGPGPATVIALMAGLAMCVVGGRSGSAAAAPGIVWATAAMIYPAITDAVVTKESSAAATVAAVVAATITAVAAAIKA